MLTQVRKLPVLAAFLLVAPLSAHPAESDSPEPSCPYARAAAEAAAMDGALTLTIDTAVPEGSLLSGGDDAAAYLP